MRVVLPSLEVYCIPCFLVFNLPSVIFYFCITQLQLRFPPRHLSTMLSIALQHDMYNWRRGDCAWLGASVAHYLCCSCVWICAQLFVCVFGELSQSMSRMASGYDLSRCLLTG